MLMTEETEEIQFHIQPSYLRYKKRVAMCDKREFNFFFFQLIFQFFPFSIFFFLKKKKKN
jgi:hypothetical protein